jgi:hypothetical protein
MKNITPDPAIYKAAVMISDERGEQKTLQLLKLEYQIRKLGYRPSDFSFSNLSNILSLADAYSLQFDVDSKEIGLFVTKSRTNSLSLWPILTPESLAKALSELLGSDVAIQSNLAKQGTSIINGTPRQYTTDYENSSGAVCELRYSNFKVSTSISCEEIELFNSSMLSTSLQKAQLSYALGAKRLMKLIPCRHKRFLDLQISLDKGFRVGC